MSPALRQSARGRDCTLRLPGVCNGLPETTVLAHALTGGMGGKCSDTVAFFACSACHSVYDRHDSRWRDYGPDELRAQALRAVGETHATWLAEGLLTTGRGR